jgi:hypothetical protein
MDRVQKMFTLIHLKGELHLTLRDVRSALSYFLTTGRTCAQIHDQYQKANRIEFLGGFYYNSWLGSSNPLDGSGGSLDRLLTALRNLDPAATSDPALDRRFGYLFLQDSSSDMDKLTFADRQNYDNDILKSIEFEASQQSISNSDLRMVSHRRLVGWLRRRWFFERRDDGWWNMLPYRSAKRLINIVVNNSEVDKSKLVSELIMAINRGEGLSNPLRLGNELVLRVRAHERARLRSFRTFPADEFRVELAGSLSKGNIVESMPNGLWLSHITNKGARLFIGLDLFELLSRLLDGYWPSVEERNGRLNELVVFKNVLSAAPYQRILLTEDGHNFYEIKRGVDGILAMSQASSDEVKSA